jgi:PII-like signaling protein
MSLSRDSEAILLRIFIGESDTYNGKPLYRYIVEYLKREGISGATVLRGMMGFGQTSRISSTSILRLSTDLPIIIEVADTEEKIDRVKAELAMIIKEGLITEERVSIVFVGGKKKPSNEGGEKP